MPPANKRPPPPHSDTLTVPFSTLWGIFCLKMVTGRCTHLDINLLRCRNELFLRKNGHISPKNGLIFNGRSLSNIVNYFLLKVRRSIVSSDPLWASCQYHQSYCIYFFFQMATIEPHLWHMRQVDLLQQQTLTTQSKLGRGRCCTHLMDHKRVPVIQIRLLVLMFRLVLMLKILQRDIKGKPRCTVQVDPPWMTAH